MDNSFGITTFYLITSIVPAIILTVFGTIEYFADHKKTLSVIVLLWILCVFISIGMIQFIGIQEINHWFMIKR